MITALLTAALVAGIAAALLGDYGASVDSLRGRHDQAQARWLARAAVDWARNVLADDARKSNVDHLDELWTLKIPPTQVDDGGAGGEVSGEMVDLSGRFNLNDLAPGGKKDAAATAAFERLLMAIGEEPREARTATVALLDWLNADTPLMHADELAAVPGFTSDRRDRLRPFVAALPAGSQFNVNAAPAEVLHARLPDLSLDAARILAVERERAWFKDVADFKARLRVSLSSPTRHLVAVHSRYIMASVRARYGQAVVRLEVLLDRRQTWPAILWQRIL